MTLSDFKPIKRQNASSLLLIVLISAVFSLLGARLFLEITSYRQISHGQWHIAHILFGGLIMFLGSLTSLIFQGHNPRFASAALLGFGFGWFIDESGKFLSSNNNYFFEPAIVFIYIIFILLFFLYRYLESQRSPSHQTIFSNRIFSMIYRHFFKKKIIFSILAIYAAVYCLDSLFSSFRFISNLKNPDLFLILYQDPDFSRNRIHLFMLGSKIFSDLISSTLFVGGLYRAFKHRSQAGIKLFRYGLLINIFFTSIFRCYFEQFSAVASLILAIFFLIGLNYLYGDQ